MKTKKLLTQLTILFMIGITVMIYSCEKDENEESGIEESTLFFKNLTKTEIDNLTKMKEISEKFENKIDTKAKELINFIDQTLRPDDIWNKERLLIFQHTFSRHVNLIFSTFL